MLCKYLILLVAKIGKNGGFLALRMGDNIHNLSTAILFKITLIKITMGYKWE